MQGMPGQVCLPYSPVLAARSLGHGRSMHRCMAHDTLRCLTYYYLYVNVTRFATAEMLELGTEYATRLRTVGVQMTACIKGVWLLTI